MLHTHNDHVNVTLELAGDEEEIFKNIFFLLSILQFRYRDSLFPSPLSPISIFYHIITVL